MKRRTFIRRSAAFGALAATPPWVWSELWTGAPGRTSRVAVIKTSNRAEGVVRAIELLELPSFGGRTVFLKPNFNSADATPGSTHPDTLRALIEQLRSRGAGPITVGDRSGMGNTREVMETKDIFTLAKDAHIDAVVLDEQPGTAWTAMTVPGMHWSRGFSLPNVVLGAGAIVQTCCLKTHRYGGHFTLSLKNSVGLVAKKVPGDSYNYMQELHGTPDQRRMIAEVNAAYAPALVVMDGVEAFVTGGPDSGSTVRPEVMVAGVDRVAVDAVGVSLLRHYGTTPEVSRGGIFEQEQIARAVQLGLGANGPSEIELVTDDDAGRATTAMIRQALDAG